MLGSSLEEREKQKESWNSELVGPVALCGRRRRSVVTVSCYELIGARYRRTVFAIEL